MATTEHAPGCRFSDINQTADFVPTRSFRTSMPVPTLPEPGEYPFVMTVYALDGRRYINRGTYNNTNGSTGQSCRFDEFPDIMGQHPYSMTVYGRGTTTHTNAGIMEFFHFGACCQKGDQ